MSTSSGSNFVRTVVDIMNLREDWISNPDQERKRLYLLNLNLISQRNESIKRRAGWTAHENQVRPFLKKHDALAFLIQINAVDVAHRRGCAAAQAECTARQQPRAPRLKA